MALENLNLFCGNWQAAARQMYKAVKHNSLMKPDLWKWDVPFTSESWKLRPDGESLTMVDLLFDGLADQLYDHQFSQVKMIISYNYV